MTNGELTDRLLNIAPPHKPIKCLLLGADPELDQVFRVVNVSEDFTGVIIHIEWV